MKKVTKNRGSLAPKTPAGSHTLAELTAKLDGTEEKAKAKQKKKTSPAK